MSPSVSPQTSVVIITRNRANRLPNLLRALSPQASQSDAEIVVVDDGSTDQTRSALESLKRELPTETTVISHGPSGYAAARNAGWRAARGQHVVFIDDDCLPTPQWLASITNPLRDDDVTFVQGPTLPDPGTIWARYAHSMKVEAGSYSFPTCNIAYRREALERVGGFEESFQMMWGEDTDLAWRVLKTGGRFAWAPEALVHHEVRPRNLREFIFSRRARGGTLRAVRRHPELRQHFYSAHVWHVSHALAIVAFAGVVLALRPGLSRAERLAALAFTIPYPRHQARTGWVSFQSGTWPAHVAVKLATDLYESLVFMRASVRERTILL